MGIALCVCKTNAKLAIKTERENYVESNHLVLSFLLLF